MHMRVDDPGKDIAVVGRQLGRGFPRNVRCDQDNPAILHPEVSLIDTARRHDAPPRTIKSNPSLMGPPLAGPADRENPRRRAAPPPSPAGGKFVRMVAEPVATADKKHRDRSQRRQDHGVMAGPAHEDGSGRLHGPHALSQQGGQGLGAGHRTIVLGQAPLAGEAASAGNPPRLGQPSAQRRPARGVPGMPQIEVRTASPAITLATLGITAREPTVATRAPPAGPGLRSKESARPPPPGRRGGPASELCRHGRHGPVKSAGPALPGDGGTTPTAAPFASSTGPCSMWVSR